ncbi:MAG: ATP-dependent metallopeptidase FtsH/Yme1/Tma family protein, partial [Clostridiaceae bacterium]
MNISKKAIYIVPISILIIMSFVLISKNFSFNTKETISYTKFLEDVETNNISKIYLTSSSHISVYLKDGQSYKTDNPRSENFKELILTKGIEVSEDMDISRTGSILLGFLVLILSSIVFIVLKKQTSSKSNKKIDSIDLSEVTNINYRFSNVAGNEEAKERVSDIIQFLKNPQKYHKYGAKMPRGLLLYGEPGTGKTLLAKAIAGEANVPFYSVSGSDFVQIYVGVGASRIRQLFKKAKASKHAVIFIDEIDAIGKKRSSNIGGSEERDQTLNALLTEMSGFEESEGIVVIAATNRIDVLDEALLRPGRFDRHIEISLPDRLAREKIINLHLENKPYKNINISNLAKKTSYFSGAKIESLMNEAAILACNENSQYILEEHVEKAYSTILAGTPKKELSSTLKDRKITACHEAGHALISSIMLPNDTISKITIIPSSNGAGGYTLTIPEDKIYQNKDYLIKRIMVLLGGRAAEELIFGKDFITTGAYNDLQNSTKIIMDMITKFGMGETLGLLNVDDSMINNIDIKTKILEECKNTTNIIYDNVKSTLLENETSLNLISNLLLSSETLYEKDILTILKETAYELT